MGSSKSVDRRSVDSGVCSSCLAKSWFCVDELSFGFCFKDERLWLNVFLEDEEFGCHALFGLYCFDVVVS